MKRNTAQKMLLVLGTALLMLPLAAADCLGPIPDVDGGGAQECTSDTDCPDQQQCHPTLQICEDFCTTDDDCGGDRPTCNVQGDAGPILDVGALIDICICNADSCAEGEECSEETGTCVPAGADTCDPANNGSDCPTELPFCDQGVCKAGCDADTDPRLECDPNTEICDIASGECVDKCSPVGSPNPLDADEVCLADGTYELACDNEFDCIDAEQLCQFDATAAEFNQCVAPDAATNICPAGAEFAGGRDADGPIIYDVEFAADPDFDADCDTAVSGTSAYVASFFYDDPTNDAYTSQSVDSFNSFLWAEEGSNPSVSTLALGFSGDATSGVAFMTICFATPPDTIAVQIEDNAGNASNVACADLQ